MFSANTTYIHSLLHAQYSTVLPISGVDSLDLLIFNAAIIVNFAIDLAGLGFFLIAWGYWRASILDLASFLLHDLGGRLCE